MEGVHCTKVHLKSNFVFTSGFGFFFIKQVCVLYGIGYFRETSAFPLCELFGCPLPRSVILHGSELCGVGVSILLCHVLPVPRTRN